MHQCKTLHLSVSLSQLLLMNILWQILAKLDRAEEVPKSPDISCCSCLGKEDHLKKAKVHACLAWYQRIIFLGKRFFLHGYARVSNAHFLTRGFPLLEVVRMALTSEESWMSNKKWVSTATVLKFTYKINQAWNTNP